MNNSKPIKTIANYVNSDQLDKALDLAVKLRLMELVSDIGELIYSPDNEYQTIKCHLLADLAEE